MPEPEIKCSRNVVPMLTVFCINGFTSTVLQSLISPFFPNEAHSKGASSTAYSFASASFNLTVIFLSPWMSTIVQKIGPKWISVFGLTIEGCTAIAFGMLHNIEDGSSFIALSTLVRIIQGFGWMGNHISTMTLGFQHYPNSFILVFSMIQFFIGLATSVGPAIGGILNNIGGYVLPFAVVGGCLLICACITFLVLPCNTHACSVTNVHEKNVFRGFKMIFKSRMAILALIVELCATTTTGFLMTTLEPHLRQFGLSPINLSLMFVLQGATLSVFTLVWALTSQRIENGIPIALVGTTLLITSSMLIGPAPFITVPTSLTLCMTALFLNGMGLSAEFTSCLSLLRASIFESTEFENDDNGAGRHAVLSGVMTTTFSTGFFFGPLLGGIFVDAFGYRNATLFVTSLQLLLLIMIICSLIAFACSSIKKQEAEQMILCKAVLSYNSVSQVINEVTFKSG